MREETNHHSFWREESYSGGKAFISQNGPTREFLFLFFSPLSPLWERENFSILRNTLPSHLLRQMSVRRVDNVVTRRVKEKNSEVSSLRACRRWLIRFEKFGIVYSAIYESRDELFEAVIFMSFFISTFPHHWASWQPKVIRATKLGWTTTKCLCMFLTFLFTFKHRHRKLSTWMERVRIETIQ